MLIIDRFEGDFAVVEDTESDTMTQIERIKIGETAKEGDVIVLEGERYEADSEATERRRNEIAELLRSLNI